MHETKRIILGVILLVCVITVKAEGLGQFVGSKNSDVYHYPSCHNVDRIKPENKIWFTDEIDALNHGYRPCKVCNPPIPEMASLGLFITLMVMTGMVVLFKKKLRKRNLVL